ncbi:hypothetical protein PP641_gp099 [Arthrobacter phage SilentRX]|uniref:Uncharacterized protein n=1 Tax=Arthrobacter phage SilentRX TaxID=2836091 RepID=A0A8F3IPQ8_9CAUD|nr:hypothetical protein PP641_gp099 [Arthrobacter phage SilentRX]QWY82839.1 hypothetical protein SEA_SILENTRX_99 [Arthrobacter phage SilentRX]
MSYLVAVTTSEIASDTNWVYLHPADSRMQLSPTPELIPALDDARRAADLADDFYAGGNFSYLITVTGPAGIHHTRYRGTAVPGMAESLAAEHAEAAASYHL